jgi:FMN-dependent NADH-azoreductase
MKLLHVDSSILGPDSVSRGLSAKAVAQWRARHPAVTVTYRDLAAEPLSHLSGALLVAQGIDASQHSAEIRHDLAVSAEVMEEFLAADVVVIGAPMYNFGIPSQLKAWIDRLAVAGKTFAYTEQGPQGLAGGKTVIIASSRGGFYGAGTPTAAFDHQETYLAGIFAFFGITDVRFVRAEGVKVSPEAKQNAIDAADREVMQLLAA